MDSSGNSVYFWLPCNAANFAHHQDRSLLSRMASEALPLSVLREEGLEFHLSSSVARRALGAVCARTSDGWARFHPRGQTSIEYLEIEFWHPKANRQVTLRLTAAGLNWFFSETASDWELRQIVEDLIEMPRAFDASTGLDHYIEEGSDAEHPYRGYLPFFQINILLGILSNPSLLPGVFLEAGNGNEDERVHLWKGNIESFALSRPGGEEGTPAMVALSREALIAFVEVTTETILLPLKWRLERTRRALLAFVMGLVHRKSRLVQVRQRLEYPESFDEGNETQLRGYVMLVAGKLPLLINVEEHLKAASEAVLSTHSGSSQEEAKELFTAWQYAVHAISDTVRGLEKAIEHAWMERTLYEQEQMRAEEEALAEIERARTRSDAITSTIDSPIFMITLVVATAALIVSTMTWPHGIRLAVGVGLGIAILAGIHHWNRLRRDRKRAKGEESRHYYEYNLSFNVELDASQIGRLLSDPIDLRAPKDGQALQEAIEDAPLQIERHSSVRVERVGDEEAIYKLHLEAIADILPRHRPRWLPWSQGRRQPVEIFSIYEIFYHRPTQNAEFLLREVRTTAIAPAPLNPLQLDELTELVMTEMIISLVPDVAKAIASGREPTMAMFDLVKQRERPRLDLAARMSEARESR